jgi:hypothetical protein
MRAIEETLREFAVGQATWLGGAHSGLWSDRPGRNAAGEDVDMVTGKLSAVERPLDTVTEPPLAALRDYWREAVAGRACLPASELRPERFARALEHTALVERIEGRHRIRLCGADMENRDLGLVRGAFLEDLRPPWYRDHVVAEVAGAIARSVPVYQQVEAVMDGKAFAFTRLMLPLASAAGAACDMLLVASVRPSDHVVSAIRARLALA